MRRYDLDWLRVFAIIVLLFYHSARPFVTWRWHINNETVSDFITGILLFVNIWHMPLFFLLSGSAAWFSMSSRPERSFAKERVKRLLIPLVFGMAVIIPPQVYIERIFRDQLLLHYIALWICPGVGSKIPVADSAPWKQSHTFGNSHRHGICTSIIMQVVVFS